MQVVDICSLKVSAWSMWIPSSLTEASGMRLTGRLCGLAVACWIKDHYHPCSNPGVGISEGCFIFDFALLPLEVALPI